MKKLFFASLAALSVLSACSRKQVYFSQRPMGESFSSSAQSAPLAPVSEAIQAQNETKASEVNQAADAGLTASANLVPMTARARTKATAPAAQSVAIADVNSVKATAGTSTVAKAKLSFVQKVKIARAVKKYQKANANVQSGAVAPKADNTSIPLLSLIFGAIGLGLVLAGAGSVLAVIFGAIGLVLGLLSLGSGRPTMALLGLIFGGIVVLLALI